MGLTSFEKAILFNEKLKTNNQNMITQAKIMKTVFLIPGVQDSILETKEEKREKEDSRKFVALTRANKKALNGGIEITMFTS